MSSNKTSYRNFKVAVYCRVKDVQKMADAERLAGGKGIKELRDF